MLPCTSASLWTITSLHRAKEKCKAPAVFHPPKGQPHGGQALNKLRSALVDDPRTKRVVLIAEGIEPHPGPVTRDDLRRAADSQLGHAAITHTQLVPVYNPPRRIKKTQRYAPVYSPSARLKQFFGIPGRDTENTRTTILCTTEKPCVCCVSKFYIVFLAKMTKERH